jgi:succinate dehydrogenase/fumarate reductase flavoprotein subunit/ABC-type nitrate/sulfonate/bicarbonate transport system substrate-binding protein
MTTIPLDLSADVVVVGGGPAGTWAALTAAEAGADVLLLDKGYCGTSGPTAAGGTGVWYVQPDPAAREKAMASREVLGGHLQDRRWMARTLDQTYTNMNRLETEARYPFPVLDGEVHKRGLQGPEYMRRMRSWIKRRGVRILDHSPVTELLVDAAGTVGGVRGHRRQHGTDYQVRAGAVVLATGGCAFLSKALGCDVSTGDGALYAAEAGAEMSGMEFSTAYAIAPAFTSVTKTAYYGFATFFRADGSHLEGAGSQGGRSVIARELLRTGTVLCTIDQTSPEQQQQMRLGQPNFFLTFDRLGIDPFTERFPITLLLEGTVRGTGGIRLTSDDCATTVPGLYAAGDAATRELVCGGFTGGGSHNSAWAMSSGTWAGGGAARFAALHRGRRRLTGAGGVAVRPTGAPVTGHGRAALDVIRAQVHPYDKNYLRHGDRLRPALAELDAAWADLRGGAHAPAPTCRSCARPPRWSRTPAGCTRAPWPAPRAAAWPAARNTRVSTRTSTTGSPSAASTTCGYARRPSPAASWRRWPDDRDRLVECLRDLRRVHRRLPHRRLRPRRRRGTRDRPAGRLPDLLHVRGALPRRRPVRHPAHPPGPGGLPAARRGVRAGGRAARQLPPRDRLGQGTEARRPARRRPGTRPGPDHPCWRTIMRRALIALTLLLTGCGGAAEAGPGDAFTLRIGAIGNSNALSGPVGYLHRTGKLVPALASQGVTGVKVVTFPNGPDLNQALAAGELDVAVYGDTPALVAKGAGQPTRLIAQAQVKLDAGILAKKSGGPTSLTGLAGKKVAVQTGSYIHRYLLGALADARIKPAEVIHIYSSDVEAALERGDVDAAAVPAANVEALKAKGYPLITVASQDHPQYLGTSATVVTETFLKAKPGIVQAWQAAQRQGVAAATADWKGFVGYTVKINGFPPPIVEATTKAEQWPAEPFTDEGLALLRGTKQFLVEQRFVRKDFDVDAWLVR